MAPLAPCCSTHGAQSAPRARKARLCRRAAVTRGACRPPSREQRRPARAQPGRVRQSRRTEGVGAWPQSAAGACSRRSAAARLAGVDRLALTWPDRVPRLVQHGLAGHPASAARTQARVRPGRRQAPLVNARSTRLRSRAPVLDLRRHGHERLLHIGRVLGARLQEGDADLVRKRLRARARTVWRRSRALGGLGKEREARVD